jgi:hypothetical protein
MYIIIRGDKRRKDPSIASMVCYDCLTFLCHLTQNTSHTQTYTHTHLLLFRWNSLLSLIDWERAEVVVLLYHLIKLDWESYIIIVFT